MKNKFLAIPFALGLAALTATATFAGDWRRDNNGWWYQYDNWTYPKNTWRWIEVDDYYGEFYDDEDVEIYHCFYFDSNGYLVQNGKTPDGYTVNAYGAWTVNGVVQEKRAFD